MTPAMCPQCYRYWQGPPERDETDGTVTYHFNWCPHCGVLTVPLDVWFGA